MGPIPILGLIPDGIIGYKNFTVVLGLTRTWNHESTPCLAISCCYLVGNGKEIEKSGKRTCGGRGVGERPAKLLFLSFFLMVKK